MRELFSLEADEAAVCFIRHWAAPCTPLYRGGYGYTTAELSVNIVRAASMKSGPLRAIGTVIHSGRQLATAEARIVGPDGELYAHGTTTCLVFELKPR